MKLSGRKSNILQDFKMGFRDEPYIIINFIFAGIIFLVFAYSAVFSPDKNNYPVVCIHEKITGEPCFSCGLSHSFSLIIRGKIAEAYTWNRYGMRVFLFFAAQMIMRIVYPVIWVKNPGTRQQLILFDSAGSLIIFLIAFWPFMESIFRSVL
jgi:hypothetical protein